MIYENETLKYEKRFEKMLEYYKSAPQKYWNSGESADLNSGITGITEQDFEGYSSFNQSGSHQCHAFAQMFLSFLFNTELNAITVAPAYLNLPNASGIVRDGADEDSPIIETDYWKLIRNPVDLQVGDMVRVENPSPYLIHTAIVTEIKNGKVKVLEATNTNYIINNGSFNTVNDEKDYDDNDENDSAYLKYNALLEHCTFVVRPKKLADPIPDNMLTEVNLVSLSEAPIKTVYEIGGTNFYFLPDASPYITVGANEEAVWKSADNKY